LVDSQYLIDNAKAGERLFLSGAPLELSRTLGALSSQTLVRPWRV